MESALAADDPLNHHASEVDNSGWVDPRRHRNPRSVRIGGGDGAVGRRRARVRPPACQPLYYCPYQPPAKSVWRGPNAIYFPAAPPFICRWGNLRRDPTAKLAADEAFPPLPQNPPAEVSGTPNLGPVPPLFENPSAEGFGSQILGHGPAGCVEKTRSPEAVEKDDDSCSPASPVAPLWISSANRDMWNECVAEADAEMKAMWPSNDL